GVAVAAHEIEQDDERRQQRRGREQHHADRGVGRHATDPFAIADPTVAPSARASPPRNRIAPEAMPLASASVSIAIFCQMFAMRLAVSDSTSRTAASTT